MSTSLAPAEARTVHCTTALGVEYIEPAPAAFVALAPTVLSALRQPLVCLAIVDVAFHDVHGRRAV